MRRYKPANPIMLGLLLFVSSVVPAQGIAAAADEVNTYKSPALYFSHYAKETAESPWAETVARSCRSPNGTFHSVKIVALSGTETIVSCHEGANAPAFTEASARLEAEEIRRAAQSRNGFDEGSVLFDPYSMLLALLKHDAEAFDDQAWTAMTKAEIKAAQAALNNPRNYAWVFPPAELQGRNPDVAAEELMPRFKEEALRRAQENPDRFMLTIGIANLKYDRATGMLNFGRPAPQNGIIVKSPLNFKHDGRAVYSVDQNDGVKALSEEQVKTAGLRFPAGQGRPGLIFDREIILHGVKLPQDAAERLLNRTQMLLVNVVLTVADGVRDPAQKGLALRPTNGFLETRIERVALTDPAGRMLAVYDISEMSENKPTEAAAPEQYASPQARTFCQSYEKRVAQARQSNNQRLIDYLAKQYRQHACAGP